MATPQLPAPHHDAPDPLASPNSLRPEPATGRADPRQHHIENISDHVKPRMASSVLLWTVLGAVLAFFVWAYFAELDRTVRGQGRVVPSSRLQVISNLEGGIVQAILVKTGQLVHRGDEVVRLDSTASGSELGSAQSAYDALTVKVARLEAEVEGHEPRFPAATTPAIQEQIGIEQALHASRMADLASLSLAAESRMIQAQRSVTEAQATLVAKLSAKDAAQKELALIRPLVDRGIEPRLSLVQQQSQADIAAADADVAAATINRAQSSVAETRAQLAQSRQEWRSQAASDLATAQSEMATRRQALPAMSDKVRRTIVRAPLDGRVNRVLVTTVGGSVRAGDPLLEIVPTQDSLVIDTLVLAKDIAFVRTNQKARIELTAYESAIYGALHGHVISISPDAVVDERTNESRYTVRVVTDGKLLHDTLGRELPIGAGMVATVSLLGDKRSVLNYILTPITRLNQTAFRE